jgi:hypothetical protein
MEAVVAIFKVMFRHFHEGTQEYNRKAGLPAEIGTEDLPNASHKRHRLSLLILMLS